MQSKSYRKHNNAQWAFTLIWALLTFLLLIITLHYQWNLYHLQKRKLLRQSAHQTELRFAALIDSFLYEIYSLPLYGCELKICQANLGNDSSTPLYKIKPEHALIVGDTLMNYLSTESVKSQLKNLANYGIAITAKPLKPNSDFLYHELPFILAITIASLILYIKFRSVLDNRFSLHYALANALKNKHFHPSYQPVKDNIKNNFCGAEVLLRWQTDTDEIIMPDNFISDAEESGLIVPISLQLIEKSFIQCSDFLKAHPGFHLAFNVSANHFIDDSFFSQFYALCARYEISAHQIMIELTERQLLDQDDLTIVKKMNDLRARGYSLAIDDFGTGHASIKYLQHFPFNYLKIDKIFIQAIGTGAITETLNQAIIHLANCLELNIIAEGVETIEQLDYLLKRKIQFVQGWYFAKAMDYEQLIQVVNGDSG